MLLAALCTSALAFAGHAGVHRSAPSRSAISAESDSSSCKSAAARARAGAHLQPARMLLTRGARGRPARAVAYGLPGSCEPFPSFDPFGFALADEGEVRWYREAEVTHGRVSMLAVVGMFSSEAGFHPFVDAPIMGASIDHVELTSPALTALLAVLAGACEAYRVQIGIKDPRAVAGDPDTPEEVRAPPGGAGPQAWSGGGGDGG